MINKVNMESDLAKIGESVLKVVGDVLYKAKIDVKETLSTAFEVKVNNKQIDVLIPGHYSFVDKGRKKGKRPPVRAILNWIRQKKISIPQGITELSFAYAVVNSIENKGIKAKPFISNLRKEIGSLVRTYVSNSIRDSLNNVFKK